MSGDGVQALASLARGEELHFGRQDARVVSPQIPAASRPFTHGVVASHGVALPQRVLVRQLALLQGLDQDGRLLVQLSGTAARSRHLEEATTEPSVLVHSTRSDKRYIPNTMSYDVILTLTVFPNLE